MAWQFDKFTELLKQFQPAALHNIDALRWFLFRIFRKKNSIKFRS